MAGQDWVRNFITQLLQSAHAQWLYRNFTLHHKTRGYLAMKNRLDVLEQIAELAEVPPEQVAPESQFLLEVDFSALVLSRLDRQVYWVVAMKAAIKGGQRSGNNHRWRRRSRHPAAETVSRGSREAEVAEINQRLLVRSIQGVQTDRRRPHPATAALEQGSNKCLRKPD